MNIKAFCFNPFYENTYILYEDHGEAWIFDPGCSNRQEERDLSAFINDNKLILTRLLLTHAHIDHILGLNFIFREYSLLPELHNLEEQVYNSAMQVAQIYGIPFDGTPKLGSYIIDNQVIKFGNQNVLCILTPGHSPGSVSFFLKEEKILISGDVLFEGSIGRTDLPGGDYNTLIYSIKSRLYPLGNDVIVYPGHGGLTTIGQEKLTNPFLN